MKQWELLMFLYIAVTLIIRFSIYDGLFQQYFGHVVDVRKTGPPIENHQPTNQVVSRTSGQIEIALITLVVIGS